MMFIIPRDPWPVGFFVFLYLCSIIGTLLSRLVTKQANWKLIASILISTVFFGMGIFIADLSNGQVDEYLMWLPLLVLFVLLNSTAATLTAFAAIDLIINICKKSTNH